MLRKYGMTAGVIAVAFASGLLVGHSTGIEAQGRGRVFELRTYTAPEGKLGALEARFRDHTRRIFDRHGMTSVGYWIPTDAQHADLPPVAREP
jgi:hypothetical protein